MRQSLGQGWVAAGKLQSGNQLQEPDGTITTVTACRSERFPDGIDVYNFRVHKKATLISCVPKARLLSQFGCIMIVANSQISYRCLKTLNLRKPIV